MTHLSKTYSILRHALTNRPWLVVATLLGVLTYFLSPHGIHPRAKVLIAWNVTQWSYIGRILLLMAGASVEKIRRTAVAHDESAEVVLTLISLASVVSLGAIIFELASSKSAEGFSHLARVVLPIGTLAGIWLIIPLLFAVNYAHYYYCAPKDRKPLRFPDEIEAPSYWDFAYFSFTIAVASQTADISVTSSAGRRLVLVQSLLSFVFNTSVLGLTINVAASLLG